MRQLTTRRRLAACAVAASLPVLGLAAANPAHAQDDPLPEPGDAAASWLAGQADGPSWDGFDGPDVSTSLDALIGLMAARVGGDQVQETLEWLNDTDVLGSYVYPAGAEDDEADIAPGAAGKAMFVVATAGGDPTDFAGIALADAVGGAAFDGLDPQTTAWAVLGLSRTPDGPADEAVAALADAQCDDGGFTYESADGGDCAGEPDTTGIAAAALIAAGEDEPAGAAVQWLLDNQAGDGSFGTEFGANANSTAMAAQALLAAGEADAAQAATAFLIGLQIGCGDDAAGAVRYQSEEDPAFGEGMRLLATAQALIPLSGQNLAELDASDLAADVPGVECGEPRDTEAEGGTTVEDEGGTPGWVIWIGIAAVLAAAAVIAAVVAKRRRRTELQR